MSGRFYPRFVKGNPQLRVFLPDWKITMIKSHWTSDSHPNNVVLFKTDVRMTDWDVKNYLEKIYKVSVGSIKSRIVPGETFRVDEKYTLVGKKDDYRIVRLTLPEGQTFQWPDLFPSKKKEEEEADQRRVLKEVMPDKSSWFM